MKPVYKAVATITLESDHWDALDIENVYEVMRKALRNTEKPVRLSHFEVQSEWDVEGKEIVKNLNDCNDCPSD